jgi:sugar lactone lactonase YvrE
MTAPFQPVHHLGIGAMLGEGPAWDTGRQCLWFVDIKSHRLYRHDPGTGALSNWQAPGQIGWALPARDGTLVTGLPGALHRFDPLRGAFEPLARLEESLPGNRLNDATTDAEGAIWFGSMDDGEQHESGRIYRYAAGRIEDVGLPPVCITNGPALSPDGRLLYHTDTLGRRIWVSDLDERRRPHRTRLFASLAEQEGYPDGPVVDSAGCVWTGVFAGWSVRCYAPDGRQLHDIRLPVANVTKVAFGGADLRDVFVTTARKGLSQAELAAQPLAGDVFHFRAEVPGVALPPAG